VFPLEPTGGNPRISKKHAPQTRKIIPSEQHSLHCKEAENPRPLPIEPTNPTPFPFEPQFQFKPSRIQPAFPFSRGKIHESVVETYPANYVCRIGADRVAALEGMNSAQTGETRRCRRWSRVHADILLCQCATHQTLQLQEENHESENWGNTDTSKARGWSILTPMKNGTDSS
jgi:hypothetical protein